MTQTVPSIELSRQGTIAVVRMTHGKANALDTTFLRALREAVSEAAGSDASGLILTGTGNIFSAGVDLIHLLAGGRAYLEEFLPEMSACFRELFVFPKPAIAAVNGHAVAGGCILACACDRRLMARGAFRIGVPELRVGVPFPMVPLDIVRFALPPHRAREAALLGRTYAPEAALEMGMVDELIEPERLMDVASAVAAELSAFPSASFRRVKHDLRRAVLEDWDRRGAAHDRETLEAWCSDTVRRAVADYVEKTLGKRP
jgi:enoyl-CoA hydratase